MLSQAVWYHLGTGSMESESGTVSAQPPMLQHPRALLLWSLRMTDYIWGWDMSVNHQLQELPLKTSGFFSQDFYSKFFEILQIDFYLL